MCEKLEVSEFQSKNEISVPTRVNLVGVFIVCGDKRVGMLFLEGILWIPNEILKRNHRTRVKKWKFVILVQKWNSELHLDR